MSTVEKKIDIAIFASGAGSNAKKIIEYFRNSAKVNIALVVCNKPAAGVVEIANKELIPLLLIDKETFFRGNAYIPQLIEKGINFIVLAGFLWKIPPILVAAYPNKIINIHPALLPNYGGKGMYGIKVHQAVLENKEKETGITIHYVNEHYDEGGIIFQQSVTIEDCKSAEEIAKKIHILEHHYFPQVIEKLITHNS